MNQIGWLWIVLAVTGLVIGISAGYYLLGWLMNTRWGRVRLSGLLNWHENPIPEDLEVLFKSGRWTHKERPKQP